jgi:hypothetical protein
MSDLTLEQEYTILSENGGTLATWEQFKQDYTDVINHRYDQSTEQLEKKYRDIDKVGSRILNYGTLTLNGLFTVACPLYAPVGVLVQLLAYKITEIKD